MKKFIKIDKPDIIAEGFAYVWITLVSYYLLSRLIATVTTYNLPSVTVNVTYNIFIAACWFGVLCAPSIILLINLYNEKSNIIRIIELTIAVFIVTITLFLLFYFS